MRIPGCLLPALLAVLLGACSALPYSSAGRAESQRRAQLQFAAADARVEQEHVSTIFAGYALFAGLKAFEGDLTLFEGVVDRIAPGNVKLEFSNARGGVQPPRPFATEFDLGESVGQLARLAEHVRRREGAPPLLVLLLTSHGNSGYLVLKAVGNEGKRLPDTVLANMLKPLEAYPTLLVISACHAGSLIPALQRPNRIIMAAAAADRTSFGCSTADSNTWFVGALQESLREGSSVSSWFSRTQLAIAAREQKEQLQPSQPQLWIGPAMQTWEKKRLTALGNIRQRTAVEAKDKAEAAAQAQIAAQLAASLKEAPAAP